MSRSPTLVDLIANHIRRFPSETQLVFTSATGSVLRDTNFRRRVWKPTLTTVGLDGLHFHDLRHSHVALLIAAGEHPKVIQERLGHSSIHITLDRYGHLFEGLDEGAADALDHLISAPDVRNLRESGTVIGLR